MTSRQSLRTALRSHPLTSDKADAGRVYEQLTALAEDPNLWNETIQRTQPPYARRRHQHRGSASAPSGRTERDLEDNIGMIELGEAEKAKKITAA